MSLTVQAKAQVTRGVYNMQVSPDEMCKLLGCDRNRLRIYNDRGLINLNDIGLYDLGPSLSKIFTQLRAAAAGRRTLFESAEAGTEELSLSVERARKAKEEADKLEMQNQMMRGELVKKSDVRAAIIGAFSRVRMKLLSIPSKTAPLVATTSNLSECERFVREQINEALDELVETDVESLSRTNNGVLGGSEATAEFDSESVG